MAANHIIMTQHGSIFHVRRREDLYAKKGHFFSRSQKVELHNYLNLFRPGFLILRSLIELHN